MLDLPVTLTDRILKPARLCTITRLDGEVIRIAEAQVPITVGADTWYPLGGLQMSAGKWTVGGEAASIQIDAAMSVGGTFDLYEVVDGKFDAAAVRVDLVDRANPTTRGLIFSGRIEPVSFGALHHNVSFDCRGHAVKAKWPFSWTFGPMCRTELGSKLCRIPLRPPLVARGTSYSTFALANGYTLPAVRVSNNDTDDPETFEDVYFECTTTGTSHASVQPSYNFTVGNTTTDGTAVFTARNAWTRYAEVASIVSEFNFTLDRDPDPRAVDGWFNQGGFRMYDGYSAGKTFQVGNWVESTRMITTYLPLGAANNSTLIAVGDKLEIWRGCDFTIATCAGVFGNSLNFRGEPYFLGAAAAAQQVSGQYVGPIISTATHPLDGVTTTTAFSASRDLYSAFGGQSRYTLGGGNAIESWADQSGSSHPWLHVGGNAPVLTTVGSRNAAYFNGSFTSLTTSTIMSTLVGGGTKYMVVSFIADSFNGSSYNGIYGDDAGYQGIVITSTTNVRGFHWDSGDTGINKTIVLGTPYVYALRVEAGVVYGRLNGGTETSTTGAEGITDDNNNTSRMGSIAFGTTFIGKIFEGFMTNTIPSASKRLEIEQDMAEWIGAI